jgi:hypothetical protein
MRDEKADDVRVTVESRPEQRRPAVTVRKIDIRASCEEILGNREMPSENRMEQQTAAVLILPIHGCSFPQMDAHALQFSSP